MTAAKYRYIPLLACLLLALLWLPSQAYAGDGLPDVIDNCAAVGANASGQEAPGPSDYTSKVVYCVQFTIQQTVTNMLSGLSDYMTGTVAAMATLALTVFGIRMFEGEHELQGKAPAFLLRTGIVLMFSYNLGGLAPYIFGIEQQLLALVSGGYSPWQQIDYFLGTLIGFSPYLVMSQGLLGIIGGALVSSTAGIAVFLAGVMALLEVILFIFDVVYTYLSAMLVIGFLLIISPLIVPLAIFYYTERYVKKWIDMLLSAMLGPALMFAILALFLAIFNILINNIFTTLGSPCANPGDITTCAPDFHAIWRQDIPMLTWLTPRDPNDVALMPNGGVNMPPVQGFINPNLRNGVNVAPVTWLGISFGGGANDWNVMSQLTFSFVALWFFASILKSITLRMPQVAESIVGAVSGVSVQSSPVSEPVRSIMARIQSAAKGT